MDSVGIKIFSKIQENITLSNVIPIYLFEGENEVTLGYSPKSIIKVRMQTCTLVGARLKFGYRNPIVENLKNRIQWRR